MFWFLIWKKVMRFFAFLSLSSLSFVFLSFSVWSVFAGDFKEGFDVNEENVEDIQVPTSGEDPGGSLLDTVKKIINYVLWLLALITLILLIYGGLQMLFSATDDAGYKKWLTILKNAAIWLAFIAFSWLIVSFIFFVLDLVTWSWGSSPKVWSAWWGWWVIDKSNLWWSAGWLIGPDVWWPTIDPSLWWNAWSAWSAWSPIGPIGWSWPWLSPTPWRWIGWG